MSTWAGIVRVSHVGRRNGERFHADDEQVADVERYAAMHKASVVFMAPELSVSGGKPIDERPALKAAIEGVESGQYTGIVVAYLSRLTRSRSGLEIWDRVEAAGGHVHCARESLDTSTSNGRFVRDIHLANAVREREEHAERYAERRRKTVEAGIWRVHQTPRGYSRDLKTRRLVPDARAGEVVAAFEDRARGVPTTVIADRLKMTLSGVRQMLRNRVYVGELRDGEHVNPSAHPALVDPVTFEAAQRSVPRPARSMSGPALLAGLIRCEACGHVMTRKRTASVVYGCDGRHSGGKCPAPASITASLVEAHVERIALRELRRLSVTGTEGRGAERAQARVEEAEAELGALLKTVTAAGLEARDFAGELRDRKAAIDDAKAELRAELARAPVMPLAGSGAEVWDSLDGHERNQLLRGLLSRVMVKRAGGRGARVPIEDRVTVFAYGDDEHVLRAPASEDPPED